jgi:hypothetical protein
MSLRRADQVFDILRIPRGVASDYHRFARRRIGSHARTVYRDIATLQPWGLVIASRYSRRAELAKHDIQRSTIRRSRDDMRRCTIRLPREPASEVA